MLFDIRSTPNLNHSNSYLSHFSYFYYRCETCVSWSLVKQRRKRWDRGSGKENGFGVKVGGGDEEGAATDIEEEWVNKGRKMQMYDGWWCEMKRGWGIWNDEATMVVVVV